MSVVHRFRPVVTQDNETFDIIYDIEHDLSKSFNDNVNEIFDNNFIKTANIKGIRKYEKLYNIKENTSLDIEDRRNVVYNTMIYAPPFTKKRLYQLLKDVFGEDNFNFSIDESNFTVVISIPPTNPDVYEYYKNRIRAIIPANLNILYSIPYTHIYLMSLTYGENGVYTYVGQGNGDYNFVSDEKGYVFVGEDNGEYTLNSNFPAYDTQMHYYTYRELSRYSTPLKTNIIYPSNEDRGEIVPLAGTGSAFISER